MVAAAVLLAVMSGCASTGSGKKTHRSATVSTQISAPVHRTDNTICPLTGLPVESGAPVKQFRGYEVGFCSDGCLTAWGLLSDSEKLQLMARVVRVPTMDRQPARRRKSARGTSGSLIMGR